MFDLGFRIKNLILFVQDNKGTDDSGNPSAQCENKDNQYRSAAFVDDGKGRKNNGENDSDEWHFCVGFRNLQES